MADQFKLSPIHPKLDIQQSWWAMSGVGTDGREWSLEEKFEKLAEAGFTGIHAAIPPEQEQEKWRRLLDYYDFSFGTGGFPGSVKELEEDADKAVAFGATYISSQVRDSLVIGDEAVSLLRDMNKAAADIGIAHFVETHRGRITQDLLRTSGYVDALPELRLTIDFSHYVLAGEMDGFLPDYEFKAQMHLNKLLSRTSCIHGRISNGQQIQIDSEYNEEDPLVQLFASWWRQGMVYWLSSADPYASLPFVCELGPTPYGIGTPNNHGPRQDDATSRWNQSLKLMKLAKYQWKKAIANQI
ncbi:sugar phosphate isomerase/epimerase family protein [Paenibacillus glycanilyticus]|uniref:sugar phosphate isomerase/epimerase family protein n=1 Tax=Paenibacillus glycanilyticus TaxID=126569 RepID=UPI000FD81D83|nr:sugar phosphate isomerase/epimerase [Paenibacillus glycanilyticus]